MESIFDIKEADEKVTFFKYKEAVAYIDEIPKFTKKNTLEHTKDFLKRLGINQNKMKIVHVAGTNGKGSVCAMLTNILVESGKDTGMFTSPHLVKVNERVRINNKIISDEDFTEAFNKVKSKVDEMQKEGYLHPSYFEFLFLMSMYIFDSENVEYVVLETGLGGRLDATNSIDNPIVTIITSIGLDHMEYLGETIEEIAGEKAGIIKENVPVVFWAEDETVKKVIEKNAEQKKAIKYAIDYSYCKNIIKNHKSVDFCIESGYYLGCNFMLPFICDYQVANALLAINAAGIIFEQQKDKNDIENNKIQNNKIQSIEIIKEALKTVCWEGRMEEISDGVFFDGAHNGPGIDEFIKTYNEYKCDGKKLILFSVVKDKDYEYMISKIAAADVAKVYVCEIGSDRGLSAEKIREDFDKLGCKAEIEKFADVKNAYSKALQDKNKDDVLFCVGSLYLIGELKKWKG